MRLLVLAPTYPHPGHPFSGIFNERAVQALSTICKKVEVLAPRPYVPSVVSRFVDRWKAYGAVLGHEIRNGVSVYRPLVPVIPGIAGSFWADRSAFVWSRPIARKMHRRITFDAILSFDLAAVGGVAWRIGRDLGIPSSGWATGGDVRVPASSSYARVVIRALQNLNLIFYQSHELREKAAFLLGSSEEELLSDRHVVLPRGIQSPPSLPRAEIRKTLRKEIGARDDDILVLSIGRITRDKGVFELFEAVLSAANQDSRITCILVGSLPAFDDTAIVERYLNKTPDLRKKVKILPTCEPSKVWEYLCAADIFAFASHHEGMPNSLLEAMAMELPAIVFAIPPVLEIEAGTGALMTVPPFDTTLFAEAILRLAASAHERTLLGHKAKVQVLDRFMVQKNMATAVERLQQIKAELPNKILTRPAYN